MLLEGNASLFISFALHGENAPHNSCQPLPISSVLHQLLLTGFCDGVELCLAVVVGSAPLGSGWQELWGAIALATRKSSPGSAELHSRSPVQCDAQRRIHVAGPLPPASAAPSHLAFLATDRA